LYDSSHPLFPVIVFDVKLTIIRSTYECYFFMLFLWTFSRRSTHSSFSVTLCCTLPQSPHVHGFNLVPQQIVLSERPWKHCRSLSCSSPAVSDTHERSEVPLRLLKAHFHTNRQFCLAPLKETEQRHQVYPSFRGRSRRFSIFRPFTLIPFNGNAHMSWALPRKRVFNSMSSLAFFWSPHSHWQSRLTAIKIKLIDRWIQECIVKQYSPGPTTPDILLQSPLVLQSKLLLLPYVPFQHVIYCIYVFVKSHIIPRLVLIALQALGSQTRVSMLAHKASHDNIDTANRWDFYRNMIKTNAFAWFLP
jgi:hypothetical protein